MLRQALGDPGLRLGFWNDHACDWEDPDDAPLKPPGPGQTLTRVDRDAQPAAAIVHDAQLREDPELLNAAGAIALLAVENADFEAPWKRSLRALAESNARFTKASEAERRKLERDLHDGAQQRLLGALLRLSSVRELAGEDSELQTSLTKVTSELDQAIHELREIGRGIYPTVLSAMGLAEALRDIARRSATRVTVTEATKRRFSPEKEAAFYYCCLEAIQNAAKHASPDAETFIRLTAILRTPPRGPRQRARVRRQPPTRRHRTTKDARPTGRRRRSAPHHLRPGRGTLVTAAAPIHNRPHHDLA